MTIQEYAARNHSCVWTRDKCFENNQDLALFAHIGGADGVYVRITRDGEFEVGRYTGAIPHIGDACFYVLGKKHFASDIEARQRAAEMFGAAFKYHCGIITQGARP